MTSSGGQLVIFIAATGDDLTILQLLLGGISYDDATLGLLSTIEALDHDPAMQGPKCHDVSVLFWASGSLSRVESAAPAHARRLFALHFVEPHQS